MGTRRGDLVAEERHERVIDPEIVFIPLLDLVLRCKKPYLRLTDFVYLSNPGLRVTKKKKRVDSRCQELIPIVFIMHSSLGN